MMEFNKYQTPLTPELLESLPQEVMEQLLDIVNNVEFVRRLVSPNRPYAKDRPRDDKGRIIVDLANPHILENMDYFRQTAIHYQKYGCYTKLRPNPNPNSEYGKWLREEIRRCWEGYVRESDGEWVTGFMYFYLNYCPIMLSKAVEGSETQANRVEDFPECWEGIYWRFHYIEQARRGGLYNSFKGGQHCAELARRGAHPYFQKVLTPEGWKLWEDINIGSVLYSTDGTICKVTDIPYDQESDYYKVTLRDGRVVYATDDHLWKIIHKGKIKVVSTSWLLNNYKHKRKANYRIPSGVEYNCFIPKNNGIDFVEVPTKVNPYTFGLLLGDECFRHTCCYFTQQDCDIVIERDYIPYQIVKWKSKYAYKIVIPKWTTIIKEYGLYGNKSEDKFIPDEYKYNSRKVRLNLLRGLMDSDGSIHGGVPYISTTSFRLAEDIMFLARSLGYNSKYVKVKAGYKVNSKYKQCLDTYLVSVYGGKEVFNLPRKKEKVKYDSTNALSRKDKTCIIDIEYIGKTPCKCVTVDSKDSCYLIGDFVTTHNCSKSYTLASIMAHNFILGENKEAHRRVMSILTAYQKEYLAGKDGTLSKFVPMIDFLATTTEFPRRRLKNSQQEMMWQMGYQDADTGVNKGTLNTVIGVSSKDDESKLRGKRGYIFFEEFGSFPKVRDIYNIVRYGVEEGNYTFGLIYLVGTSGDDANDFEGAQELLYYPTGYNIYSMPNVFDKVNQGKKEFAFFFPVYINRKGCYNKDGVSDVIKALIEVLNIRYKTKYNSSESNTLIRVIADMPITPSEAIIKTGYNMFPVTDLTARLQQLETDPSILDEVYIADLTINKTGNVEYKPSAGIPIRDFPTRNNKVEGAIELYQLPEIDKSSGKPYHNRYIAGADPYDNDEANTMSLGSIFVLDLWTDKIVAEYTGRPLFADDYFEVCRKLCLFYNARLNYEQNKKGLFGYFSQHNCTYLLTDVLDFLKDKSLAKGGGYGNTSKGTTATAPVNAYAKNLIRKWLLEPIPTVKNIDGEDTEILIPRLYNLKNKALIKELIGYNTEGNFDRISAMGMLMLLREDKMIMYQGNISRDREKEKSSSYLGNDPFFERNYGSKD